MLACQDEPAGCQLWFDAGVRRFELYLKVGTRQASHASATSDGTKAARYPSIKRFIVLSPSQIWRLSTEDRDDMLSGEF